MQFKIQRTKVLYITHWRTGCTLITMVTVATETAENQRSFALSKLKEGTSVSTAAAHDRKHLNCILA